jgi:hypothetical protein
MAMYENYKYQGHKLSEWAEAFHNLFSLGELYRMAQAGVDFNMIPGFKPIMPQ